MKRIGPRMAQVCEYVRRNPGRAMRAAAHAVSPCPFPEQNESYGYNTVHRAISAGLVVAKRGPGNSWLLFPVEET